MKVVGFKYEKRNPNRRGWVRVQSKGDDADFAYTIARYFYKNYKDFLRAVFRKDIQFLNVEVAGGGEGVVLLVTSTGNYYDARYHYRDFNKDTHKNKVKGRINFFKVLMNTWGDK